VLVSGAAGGRRHRVGQIAKIKGARAVGMPGGGEVPPVVDEWVFDAAVDYKGEGGPSRRTCARQTAGPPSTVFFDNVGGEILTSD